MRRKGRRGNYESGKEEEEDNFSEKKLKTMTRKRIKRK